MKKRQIQILFGGVIMFAIFYLVGLIYMWAILTAAKIFE